MNKILSLLLFVVAVVLITYNVTLVNFANPLEGNSIIALIGIVASLCAIALLLIYITSSKISDKMNKD